MKSKNRIHSINRQMVCVFVSILAVTIMTLGIVNTCFLADFYIFEKKEAMESEFMLVNQAASEDKLQDDDFKLSMERAHANHNISVFVMNSAGDVIYTTTHGTKGFFADFLKATFQQGQLSNHDILLVKDNYFVLKQVDRRLDEEYLVLCGTLDNGNLIMMRSAVESIRESTRLSNRFLILVGALALVLGIVAVVFLTHRITRPIMRLTEISKRMANLDFEAKYESQGKKNEVDVLGEHMNAMSEALEKNILDLKQANHDLQADIALKEERQKSQQEFVANVSHELKTPIAVIQGYAEGLAEGVIADEESRDYYCGVIVDEAKKMNRMVMSLISLNQIESGNSEISYERFDIMEMIDGITKSMQVLFEQEQIQLEMPQEKSVYVYADEIMVEQVLTNYMSNAIHYAKGNKTIKLSVVEQQNTVRIGVYNSGDQIPEENLAYIWDKFYKVDKARTREYGGTGIGLSIVKAIMENLHQKYGVDNCENGVEFWFELER